MYTIEQVAHEIEQLKPDFADFLSILINGNTFDTKERILREPNLFVKLLQTEIYIMYNTTHCNKHYYSAANLEKILTDNLSNHGVYQSGIYSIVSNYIIKKSFDPNYHILAHIKKPKHYIPKYLWDKVRTVKHLTKSSPKQLKPDAISLVAFKTYLQSQKSLKSTQAEEYLKQLRDPSFAHIREDFMDVIFSKCTKPSIDLQKQFAGQIWSTSLFVLPNQDSTTLCKYMALSRSSIRNLANKLNVPVTHSIYDTLDSIYKPFITSIYRKPDTDINEISYLFSALTLFQISVLKEPNPVYSYFIECLIKHLQAHESATIVNELKQNFLLFNQAVTQLQL